MHPIIQTLCGQVLLVYGGAGMTAIDCMATYANTPTTMALLLPEVAAQCAAFKRIYLELQEKHGDDFKYLRLIDPNELQPLNISNFPDLNT